MFSRFDDLPVYQPGDPSNVVTYIVAIIIAGLILGTALALSLRKGN